MNSRETIYSLFRAQAVDHPDRPAILAPGKTPISFGKLLEFVDASRKVLHGFGIGRGTRLGVLMSDRPQTAIANLLCVSTCTSVPINPEIPPGELEEFASTFRIDGLLMSESTAEMLGSVAHKLSSTLITTSASDRKSPLFKLVSLTVDRSSGIADDSLPDENDVVFLLKTSGTTGGSKIVPQTHLNRITTSSRIGAELKMTANDRCLNLMPMHHTQGLSAELLAPLINGVSVAVCNFDPRNLLENVDEFQPTWFNLVPSMHQSVLEGLGDRTGVFTDSSLRFVTTSSSKLTGGIRERLELAYGVPVAEQYGVSECSAVSYSGFPWNEFRQGSVGQPLHEGVRVFDQVGNELPAPHVGEICVTGHSVISGYENNPEENEQSFRDGWFRTGDEGYFDEHGFLYITGRVREIINRGGEKFSLPEVDEVLHRLEGVATAAAFVAPHQKLGHEVYAAVVLEPGTDMTHDSLRALLAQQLSWAKVPKRVFILDELPMNSIGKVLRQKLTDELFGVNAET